MPLLRDVRSFTLNARAGVQAFATQATAGSLKALYRLSAAAGGVLTASNASAEQLRADATRSNLSVDARLARAAFRGIVTGATSAVAGVAAGAACAPAALTVVGVVVVGACAAGAATVAENVGSTISGAVLDRFDWRFGF